MADDVRESLRAAQTAELRGDKGRAIEHLKRAAELYRDSGKPSRALQMLRHAQRVDGTREDVLTAISGLQGLPGAAPEAGERILPEKHLVERGPVRADSGVPGWCSFCCRPHQEVGPLVAGPAGAFICATCVAESRALLSPEEAAGAPSVIPVPLLAGGPPSEWPASIGKGGTAAPLAFIGQPEAVRSLEAALRLGARWVLLVGPEGCGKSSCLRDLERRNLGFWAADATDAARAPGGSRLLIDAGGPSECQPREAELAWLLECMGRHPQGVLAMRGTLPPPAVVLEGSKARLPLFSTRELVAATSGRLPAALASRVQVTVSFRELTVAELIAIARQWVARRAGEVELSDELLAAIAGQAARSGRGGRELDSLIARVPPGSWKLSPAPPGKRRAKPGGRPRRQGR